MKIMEIECDDIESTSKAKKKSLLKGFNVEKKNQAFEIFHMFFFPKIHFTLINFLQPLPNVASTWFLVWPMSYFTLFFSLNACFKICIDFFLQKLFSLILFELFHSFSSLYWRHVSHWAHREIYTFL